MRIGRRCYGGHLGFEACFVADAGVAADGEHVDHAFAGDHLKANFRMGRDGAENPAAVKVELPEEEMVALDPIAAEGEQKHKPKTEKQKAPPGSPGGALLNN